MIVIEGATVLMDTCQWAI